MKKVLILCTGNRCRSQMAEGILQTLHPDWQVCSAGILPAKEVHPLVVKVMAEIGIDIAKHYPKHVEIYVNDQWDLVLTVCGGANENCPIFKEQVAERIHIGFDDPDDFIGTEDQIINEFRRVRNEIYQKMKALC